jgi:hypothetical protein
MSANQQTGISWQRMNRFCQRIAGINNSYQRSAIGRVRLTVFLLIADSRLPIAINNSARCFQQGISRKFKLICRFAFEYLQRLFSFTS